MTPEQIKTAVNRAHAYLDGGTSEPLKADTTTIVAEALVAVHTILYGPSQDHADLDELERRLVPSGEATFSGAELRALLNELRLARTRIVQLQLKPPMGCTTCECHNEQLVERIDAMVAAVCDVCKGMPAFVASQKWPLDPPPEQTEEEFQAMIKDMDQRAAETEADIQAHIASKGG